LLLSIWEEPILDVLYLPQQIHSLYHSLQEFHAHALVAFNREEIDLLGECILTNFVVASHAQHELLYGLSDLTLDHCEVLSVHAYLT
jgi:hypothetical protein